MYFPQYLGLALATFFTSTHATPLGLSERQTVPENIHTININFCTEWNEGGTCTSIPTFTIAASNTDNEIISNFANQINTDLVNGCSSITVRGAPGAWCVFGYQILSTSPGVICGGWSEDINTGDPTYNIVTDTPLNDNVLCFFCASQAS